MKPFFRYLLVFLFVSLGSASCDTVQKDKSTLISPDELTAKKDELILIDVRTPQEFEAGHIENAVNINIADGDFKERLEALDKNKAVAVYCKVGGRSAKAAQVMKEMGFEEVYDLEGGIRNWERKGMQTVK